MSENSITFFPVGNGDTSLIRLEDNTTILIDCNIREPGPGIYDVRTYLLRMLEKNEQGTIHSDVFILTHPDQDHCRGLENLFFLDDPSTYSAADKRAGLILIEELWFAPRIFNEYKGELCEDAQAFREEAERRIALYLSGDSRRNDAGNRLRLIGATDSEELEGLEEITTYPGELLKLFNGRIQEDCRLFIFAPVKRDSDDENSERNQTAIVFQARFDVQDEENAVRAFFGGDANCEVWERIADLNTDENLAWDLLLAPHHCSWTFFGDAPYDENSEPSEKVMEILNQKRGNAYVISSSKPIKDDDDNPPHHGAKLLYVSIVGNEALICTGEHPTESDPEPIYFTMTINGPVIDDLPGKQSISSGAAISGVTSKPRTYGKWRY